MREAAIIGAYVTGLLGFAAAMFSAWTNGQTARDVENLRASLGLKAERHKATHAHAAALDLANRKARLDRIGLQLKLLYGPLHALASASHGSWTAFRSVHRPNRRAYFGNPDNPPDEADLAAWRLWMSTVFMPLNLDMERLVLSNTDLLVGDTMPRCLIALCAHVQAYKTVTARWAAGDFSNHTTPLNYPAEELQKYAATCFSALKAEQEKLLQLLVIPTSQL